MLTFTIKIRNVLKMVSFHNTINYFTTQINKGECRCGVMVKVMDCGYVVSEFVLQSRYYIHFRANTLGKGMNLLILLAMG